MTHLFVTQLRFARSEFQRGLMEVSEQDALKQLGQMNCISWIVGHLANQEQRYWLLRPGTPLLYPDLNALVGYGSPASTPPLADMWTAWKEITRAADLYLETLTPEKMQEHFIIPKKGIKVDESIGTMLMRNIYHYWYHLGEATAIRQMLGHTSLPEFVGPMSQAAYLPES